MIRLYINEEFKTGKTCILQTEQSHYLTHVMRLKDNAVLHVFNGSQGLWQATLQSSGKKDKVLQMKTCLQKQEAKTCPVILAAALIKKEHFDFVLQKATELGATHIVPLITTHTIVRSFNIARARRIVIEACEQSERLTIPVISEPVTLSQFLQGRDSAVPLYYLAERTQQTPVLPTGAVCFLVGPEGGLSDEDKKALSQAQNAFSVSLGKQILRAETASIMILSAYQWGKLNMKDL